MNNLILPFYLLTALLWPLVVHSSPAPVKSGQRLNLTPYIQILQLAERNAETKAWELPDSLWQPAQACPTCVLYFAPKEKPAWLRFELQGADVQQSSWILELAFPNLKELNVYILKDGQLVQEIPGGTKLGFAARLIKGRTFAYPLQLSYNERLTVYLYAYNPGLLKTPLYISDYALFLQNQTKELLFYGLYFGAALGIVLYSFFLLLKLRDVSYLFYVLYGFGFLVLTAGMSGLGFQYIWPQLPWLATYFFPLSVVIIFTFWPLFFASILGMWQQKTWCLWLIYWELILSATLLIAILTIPPQQTHLYSYFVICFGVIANFLIILQALLKKNRVARFLMLAYGLLLPTAILLTLRIIKVLPPHFLSDEILYIASVAELLLFSFALSDRYEQVELHRQKIEQKARSHALFFSAVGHDLRQPLGVILGYAEHLRRHPEETATQQIIQKIADAAQSLEIILQDVMDFDRLETGRMISQISELDIDRDLFVPLQNIFITKAQAKGLSLIFENDAPQRYAADVPRLLRILMNLVSNAIKYTEVGGILISFREKREKGKTIGEFSIRDSGIGINQEDLPLIFQEYVRVGKYSSDLKVGVGLGLTIVKKLVEYLQGEITVESEPGKGSVFVMRLPLQPFNEHFHMVSQNKKEERNLLGLQVLAVDDDPEQLQLLSRVTSTWNMSLTIAHSQTEALEKLRDPNFNCDVALLDWHIGNYTGLEVAERIWQLRPGLQVLFISGEESLQGKVFPIEVHSILSKPLRFDVLYRELWGISLSIQRFSNNRQSA